MVGRHAKNGQACRFFAAAGLSCWIERSGGGRRLAGWNIEVPVKRRIYTRSSGLQAAKAAAARKAAIKGAIDCFVDLGYARSSTIEIAKRARLTRGAMIHHFPTKRRLLEATVDHLIAARIGRFKADLRKVTVSVADRISQRGVDLYWRHLHSRLFTAYFELVIASRTDSELARVLRAANRRFDREWYRTVQEMFPEWRDLGSRLDLAMDLTQFLLEGMALNKLSHDARQRRLRIRRYLKARLVEILAAGEAGEGTGALQAFLQDAPHENP